MVAWLQAAWSNLICPDGSNSLLAPVHGIRALCAVWMIVYHSFAQTFPFITRSAAEEMIKRGDQNTLFGTLMLGFSAVDVFFFITGLVIAYPLLKKPESELSSLRIREWCWQRYVVRLLPVYVVVFIIDVLVMMPGIPLDRFSTQMIPNMVRQHLGANATHASVPWQLAPFHFLFINNFVPFAGCLIATWSLAIQGQFYLLFAYMARAAKQKLRLFWWSFIAVWISLAFRIATFFIFRDQLSQPPSIFCWDDETCNNFFVFFHFSYAFTPNRLATIFIGVCFAFFQDYIDRTGGSKKAPIITAVFENYVISFAGTGLCIYFLSRLPLYHEVRDSWFFTTMYLGGGPLLGLGLFWIFFVTLNRFGLVGRLLHRLFSMRVWRPISVLSYTTFLFHPALISKTYWTWFDPPSTQTQNLFKYAGIHVSVSFVVAFVVYFLVEFPASQILSKRAMKSTKNA